MKHELWEFQHGTRVQWIFISVLYRVGNSLFRSFALRSFAHSLFALSLKIVQIKKLINSKKIFVVCFFYSFSPFYAKEQLWANPSACSEQKSDREQFALFHERIALSLFLSQKTSKWLEKPMREFPTLLIIETFRYNSNKMHFESASYCSSILGSSVLEIRSPQDENEWF